MPPRAALESSSGRAWASASPSTSTRASSSWEEILSLPCASPPARRCGGSRCEWRIYSRGRRLGTCWLAPTMQLHQWQWQ
ncbi:hypothetical protein BJY01DRAFT_209493 [Aspergillus pseudoustus]|uniref:Uncharacterized protein n=1 Tax=Aspergillus pseudoustus TaxID=1810923 RepID=A0ABR4KFG8_9EURO